MLRMLMTIESMYACDFLLVDNTTYILSRTIFQLLRSIGQVTASDRGASR